MVTTRHNITNSKTSRNQNHQIVSEQPMTKTIIPPMCQNIHIQTLYLFCTIYAKQSARKTNHNHMETQIEALFFSHCHYEIFYLQEDFVHDFWPHFLPILGPSSKSHNSINIDFRAIHIYSYMIHYSGSKIHHFILKCIGYFWRFFGLKLVKIFKMSIMQNFTHFGIYIRNVANIC